MIEIVIGIALLFIALAAIKWLTSVEPGNVLHVTRILGGGLLGLLAVFLMLRGKVYIALPVMLVALGLIRGWLRLSGRPRKLPGDGGGKMTAAEAYEILGLKPGATKAEIKAAHRRLVARIHPDHGGSDYLTTKINQAKDYLLKE